ncbi:Rossmann-like and DUF2520 domain-containing protein [Coxiella burnetii]|uniref:Hypothetical cytosolic protein n=2 Tax=Coxiella burnetii TaxID=777 RepID=A9KDI7_COXBN|nr:Rossmann-like and DUF2520 domain-containing protein [Coxiella burnetii]ABS78281.1 hypothetical cytosolic protein [Coxiella burnetii Dugway 5J108-111]ACJ17789.1 hypothetical cytosolic protein [Coxiella burnetii CbuG_Q212]ATN66232.1 hypothetical protein AYM17_01700 [Coxiella burnetii]OYK80908.1 DUF2520 domain-containing protein [Coxiella burnetii]OYK82996.1 DUF2520 domain-containing protein [Coxiella burnetii]
MRKPLINIIGAGRLGKTIARLVVTHEAGIIKGICNATFKNAEKAAQFIGQGKAFNTIESLPPADITVIATPDDYIEPCCQQLSRSKNLKPASIILHCSGSLSSEILFPVVKKGCFTASAHPLQSFAVPELVLSRYKGTYCAIEGHSQAIPLLNDIFTAIGSLTFLISAKKKAIYHAAGVFASNYLVTIANTAAHCLKEAGVEEKIALEMIIDLMKGTLNNLETTLSPAKSLTGPLKRGDINTILKHLHSLPDKKLLELYKTLAFSTLEIAALPEEEKENIENLLHACEGNQSET